MTKIFFSLILMNYPGSIINFTDGIIDYAGLFPPANLDLNTAFKNYLLYRNGDYSRMLSKFICPLKLFNDLSKLVNGNNPDVLVSISALGNVGKDRNQFEKNFADELSLWKNFEDNVTNNCKVNSFEVKIPDEILNGSENEIYDFVNFISADVKKNISHNVFIFLECSLTDNWRSKVKNLVNSISKNNQSDFNTGLKIRTGGIDASAFPTSGQIAYSIRVCLDRKVPVKFTAGLHHPFRHFDKSVNTMSHGFINVFSAGIIAARHNITDIGMEEIIDDENPEEFIFTDEYFSWKDWKVDNDGIKFARETLVISYGSCSFDEPVEDLKKLNLF